MTVRLVGLMSFVLLLSLAAFALLTNHYQDQVMKEVEQTVSAVGRAALNSFVHRVNEPGGEPGMVWVRQFSSGEAPVKAIGVAEMGLHPELGEVAEGEGTASLERRKMLVFGSFSDREVLCTNDLGEPVPPHRVERFRAPLGPEERVFVHENVAAAVDADDPAGASIQWSYSVQVDDVRAEDDPDRGLVLKIPTMRPSGDGSDVATIEVQSPQARLAGSQDIVLPIDTEDYRNLFSRFERGSLALFLGVFAVGTVLSAGLATRFTRPIRRLDRGLRRISDGHLDTAVEDQGRDEMARLGRAFNDMTRKLRANRDRERELTRREKLSALGRLAAGVAHDVRNPLHSIGLTLQHLQETGRPESDEARQEFDRSVGLIRAEIGRLDGLVDNFLRFASTDRRELQSVDFAELLRETARLVKKEAEWRDIQVELEIDDDIPPVAVDAEAMRSSILNLVLNSFEAMPSGGRVVLGARKTDHEIELSVADDGTGIPDEDRERVFEFAYTTRDGGHGLGLAMVHQCVVEDHGGRVQLESEPGRGTRVTLVLPRANETP
jgi:signal transduction histidine kinase